MKRTVIYVVASVFCLGLKAQVNSTQDAIQKAKAINEVKLSEQAMYAEVVELVTDDNEAVSLAQQKSINKLQNNVIEACARKMNLSKEQAKEIFDIIDDKCQNVVIKKGDMLRVFAYIAKDAVGLSRKKAKQEDIDAIFGPDNVVDSTEVVDNNDKGKQLTDVTTNTISTTTDVILPVDTLVMDYKGDTLQIIDPEPNPLPKVVIPELCQNLIAEGNFNNVRRYLEQEKTYHRLMYGPAKSMKQEICYIVLTEKGSGKIVAVLDKGKSERLNFITMKMDHFDNYQDGSYRAIFVQEY